jgi:hypothetical protein
MSVLTACGTTLIGSVKPPPIKAVSCLSVWTEQPFYWPEKCVDNPNVDECPLLQRIARIAQANNAARQALEKE